MIKKIKEQVLDFFSKNGGFEKVDLQEQEHQNFILKIESIEVGFLSYKDGIWCFRYSEVFKEIEGYNLISGFPILEKIYHNKTLWPFFKTRIPGLGQPVIKEILEREKIDGRNELALLKRFGGKTITNPYLLVLG